MSAGFVLAHVKAAAARYQWRLNQVPAVVCLGGADLVSSCQVGDRAQWIKQ